MSLEIGEYQGGKPAGCLSKHPNGAWQVSFRSPSQCLWYGFKKFGGGEAAYAIALAKQEEISLQRGLTRNRWRIIRDVVNGTEWIEMKLTQGYTSLFDRGDLGKVIQHTWHALSVPDSDLVYAVSWVRGGHGKRIQMHTLLTGYDLVHHRSRNALDNRRGVSVLTDLSNPFISQYDGRHDYRKQSQAQTISWHSAWHDGHHVL